MCMCTPCSSPLPVIPAQSVQRATKMTQKGKVASEILKGAAATAIGVSRGGIEYKEAKERRKKKRSSSSKEKAVRSKPQAHLERRRSLE